MNTASAHLNVKGALLVSLTLNEFGNNKQDAKATAELVANNHLSDSRAARVWKTLLPKGSSLDDVKAALRFLRNFHYRNTHAYIHDGPRILPTKNYAAYQKGIRQGKDMLESAVLNLVRDLDVLKEAAKLRLGGLYCEADYPTASDLKAAYGVKVTYSPMPASDTLLDLGLEPQEMVEMRAKLEREMNEAMLSANRKMWSELHDRLSTMLSQMLGERATVHEKTFEGLKSLVDILPRMNLTGDAALESMAQRLANMLKALDGRQLRSDPELRQQVATEAKTVFGVMSSFMNARRAASPAATPLEMKIAA